MKAWVAAFTTRMDLCYAAADLAVVRAGASTLAELTALGVPSVLVPYPGAGNHQRMNALELAATGAAVVLEEGRLGDLMDVFRKVLFDDEHLATMSRRARELGRPKAAEAIALDIVRLTEGGTSRP